MSRMLNPAVSGSRKRDGAGGQAEEGAARFI
jgi:hypothetical protein